MQTGNMKKKTRLGGEKQRRGRRGSHRMTSREINDRK